MATVLCDSCTEAFEEEGMAAGLEFTTGELHHLASDMGYMMPDHTCDNPSVCVCSGHKK